MIVENEKQFHFPKDYKFEFIASTDHFCMIKNPLDSNPPICAVGQIRNLTYLELCEALLVQGMEIVDAGPGRFICKINRKML